MRLSAIAGPRLSFSFAMRAFIALMIVAGITAGAPRPAAAKTGTYTIALLQVNLAGETTHLWSVSELTKAASEVRNYFAALSNGSLDMQVRVARVTIAKSPFVYDGPCGAPPGPSCSDLVVDAAQAAVAAKFDFKGVNGIAVLRGVCAGRVDVTVEVIKLATPSGTYTRSYDYECDPAPRLPPRPSGVFWSPWAHEWGHQLQIADGVKLVKSVWKLHPTAYASGYSLMDSCYPCQESLYGLLGPSLMAGSKTVFPGWIPDERVVTVDAPTSGATVVLAPLSAVLPSMSPAKQGIKVPLGPGHYYLVEARKRQGVDDAPNTCCGTQLYDEGVRIQEITESGDPPARDIDTCDSLVAGGCLGAFGPGCSGPVSVLTRPAYCWPYPLWHVGDTFSDTANKIQVAVVAATGDGYAVTITRGAGPARPDVYLLPWRSPPMNTWETPDIWVDSSCNGYEVLVGTKKGLRYGRRLDSSVIGSGDDPCANHENRIYARVRNGGDAPAKNVVVHFNVSKPVALGMTGPKDYTSVGTATAATFPELASIAPGASAIIYVPWTPLVASSVTFGAFSLHTCLQVVVDKLSDELVTQNQNGDDQRENIGTFQAVLDAKTLSYRPILQEIKIRNSVSPAEIPHVKGIPGGPRSFSLFTRSALPRAARLLFNKGSQQVTVPPRQTVILPLRIVMPRSAPIGATSYVDLRASTVTALQEPAHPFSLFGQTEDIHLAGMGFVTGVAVGVHTVRPSRLSIRVRHAGAHLIVSGRLLPAALAVVTLDFSGGKRRFRSQLASTDLHGAYRKVLPADGKGPWTVRALWQGNMRLASTRTAATQAEG